MGHYPFEKLVGGLVDLKKYGGHEPAEAMLERVVDVAIKSLDRTRDAGGARLAVGLHSGTPGEWWPRWGRTSIGAYELTGKAKYKRVWGCVAVCRGVLRNKFAETADPKRMRTGCTHIVM